MMNKIVFGFLILFSNNINSGIGLVSKIYCKILGNNDASEQYREKVYQALKELGIDNPLHVPVKRMNGVGPAFARLDLSSFTAFGIWLDEEYLNRCTPEEQTFHIFHEASHYAKKHHQKIVAGSAIATPLLIAAFIKINNSLKFETNLKRYAALTAAGAATILGSYLYILPKIVKKQEKEADITAAKTLIKTGNEQIVNEYITTLKKYRYHLQNNIWWYSINEQIKYLERLTNNN